MHCRDGLRLVWHMVEHVHRYDCIERAILEGQGGRLRPSAQREQFLAIFAPHYNSHKFRLDSHFNVWPH
jgi:hypothetical protein